MRVIRDNKELEGGEKGLWGVTGGHKRIQEVTEGYSWLKWANTGGYRVTGNYRLVLFILENLGKLIKENLLKGIFRVD